MGLLRCGALGFGGQANPAGVSDFLVFIDAAYPMGCERQRGVPNSYFDN